MKKLLFALLLLPFIASAQPADKFEYIDDLKKCTVQTFENKFNGMDAGIIFFYPKDNAEKLKLFKNQVQDLTVDPRFKNSKIVGISHETTVNDKDNMFFENFNISDIQCIIYCKDLTRITKALKKFEFFELKSEALPENYYLIDIKKEEVCVRETRIAFFGALIYEILDPTLTDKEIIQQQLATIEKLNAEVKDLTIRMTDLQAQYNDCINETKTTIEVKPKLSEESEQKSKKMKVNKGEINEKKNSEKEKEIEKENSTFEVDSY